MPSSVSVFACSCGYVESDTGPCCRKCGTKNPLTPMVADLRPAAREKCCGIRYEQGAFTQSQPCHDCPEVKR